MHLLERNEQHLYVGVYLSSPYKDEELEPIFAHHEGDEQVAWEGDCPAQKSAWRDVAGIRTPCDFYPGFGFLTNEELWEHRKNYPRDGI
jgi:hypothetical protein